MKSVFGRVRTIALAFLLSGCTAESATEPQLQLKPHDLPRFVASSDLSQAVMTVWENGIPYTLDVPNRALRFDDGQVLYLDDELTAQVATAFQSMNEGDVLSPALSDAACSMPEMCVEPYSAGQTRSGAVTYYGPDKGEVGPVIRVITPPREQSRRDPKITLASGNDCNELAGIMLQTTTEYRSQRTSWLSELRSSVFKLGSGAYLSRVLQGGTQYEALARGAAIAVYDAAARVLYAHTTMGIYGTLWNSYSCQSRTVQATGWIVLGGTPSSSGGFELKCHWDTAWIEIGGTSKNVDVYVCHWEAATQ